MVIFLLNCYSFEAILFSFHFFSFQLFSFHLKSIESCQIFFIFSNQLKINIKLYVTFQHSSLYILPVRPFKPSSLKQLYIFIKKVHCQHISNCSCFNSILAINDYFISDRRFVNEEDLLKFSIACLFESVPDTIV